MTLNRIFVILTGVSSRLTFESMGDFRVSSPVFLENPINVKVPKSKTFEAPNFSIR